MAYIDHTRLIWKNGKYIGDGVKLTEDGNDIIHLCPFEYGRDGNITSVQDPFGNMIEISDDIKQYHDEYDSLYQRKGLKEWDGYWRRSISGFFYHLTSWLTWKIHRMERVCYRDEVGVWSKGDTEIYIYHNPLKSSYVSFYRDGSDSYILLGGYGHHENVYTHFVGRGYGEELEAMVAKEAYEWCCEDILTKIAELVFNDSWDDDGKITELREKFYIKEDAE